MLRAVAGEIQGTFLINALQSIYSDQVAPYLARHGLINLYPHQWYSLQLWLDILAEMFDDHPGLTAAMLTNLGLHESEAFVSDLDLETALLHLDTIYQVNTRGAGKIVTEKVTTTHYRIHSTIPYPEQYLHGLLKGLAKRFLGNHFTLTYDTHDDHHTVYHLQWS